MGHRTESGPLARPFGENGSMRKRRAEPDRNLNQFKGSHPWIDIEEIATVEVTSEDPNFPIDSVFGGTSGAGWRASQKGEQRVRLIFDYPLAVQRIQLQFLEPERERTQEFILRWSSVEGGQTEIVRQQWNFSPAGSTSEVEDYEVNLDDVSVLELVIRPDLTHQEAPATLAGWRIA
jgi:hypothetical protein